MAEARAVNFLLRPWYTTVISVARAACHICGSRFADGETAYVQPDLRAVVCGSCRSVLRSRWGDDAIVVVNGKALP
jgi:hypothetical protein